MSKARSVYELEGSLEGEVLYIVGPGPSAGRVEGDPSILDGQKVLALNSSIEFLSNPTWWMYADKRFSYIYQKELHSAWPQSVIMVEAQTRKFAKTYKGELFSYEYQLQFRALKKARRGVDLGEKPFWYWPERRYLAGRCTIFSHALSLALLMRPRAIVVIGVDFSLDGSRYYVDSVERNPGPTERERALWAGARWIRENWKKKVWRGLPPMYSVSESLVENLRGVPVTLIDGRRFRCEV